MNFFNPNVTVKSATIEGHTGANAGFYLPFSEFGYWFASGQEVTFLTGEITQRSSKPLLGLSRPNTFQKDCCGCPVGTELV